MDKKIAHLGHKRGKLLLFGGVYSNLQALQAVIELAHLHQIEPTNCICTGDIIGYCGQPRQTLETFLNWGAYSILGNVEIQLRDDRNDCGCDFTTGSRCDTFSDIWYAFAKANIPQPLIDQLHTLPDHITFTYANRSIGVVHGSTDLVSQFIFKSTSWNKKLGSFKQLDVDTIVAGHCGLPFTDASQSLLWLNPGVIGMPANDGVTHTWVMIIDDQKGWDTQHVPLAYDYQTAVDHMLINRLPISYARTLQNGIWDNMEVLPPKERLLQGLKYNF